MIAINRIGLSKLFDQQRDGEEQSVIPAFKVAHGHAKRLRNFIGCTAHVISRLVKWLASTIHASQLARSRQIQRMAGRLLYRLSVWRLTNQARKACHRADCIIAALHNGGTVAHGVATSKRWLFTSGD